MSAISGKNGKVVQGSTDLVDTLGWTLNLLSNNPAYASNATSGVKTRVVGVADSNGTVTFAYQGAAAEITQGQAVTLKLYLNATKFWTVPAVIDSIAYNTDINDGNIVSVTASFSGTGAVSLT